MYYDKRIRYLNYYESGIKLQNAGYVKFQVREYQCQMMIYIKGPRLMGSAEALVYLITDVPGAGEERRLLGKINIRNGQGHCGVRLDARQMGDAGLRYDEVCGICIKLQEYQYLESRWQVEHPMLRAPLQETPETMFFPEIRKKEEELPAEEKKEEFPTEEKASAEVEEIKQPAEPEEIAEETLAPEEEPAREVSAEEEGQENPAIIEEAEAKPENITIEKTEPGQETVIAEEVSEEQPAETEEKIVKELKPSKWEQLKETYPVVHPVREEEEYLKIEPKDFVIFTEKYQNLTQNSFLLHGYYNYKHLILGRKQKGEETVYYLGVPGIFHDREKTVAVMFGFEAFDCKREPAENGDFGYYLKRVEL